MNRILLVARREYMTNVRRPAFIFAAFGVPIMMVVIFGVIFLASTANQITDLHEFGSVGMVDNSSSAVLAPGRIPEGYADLFIAYPDADAARAALDATQIAAYFELPANYMVTGRVLIYTNSDTPDLLTSTVEELLLLNLTAAETLPVPLERIQNGANLTIRDAESGREVSEGGVFITLFFPIIFAFILIMSAVTTSGFLMQGLVEERTTRIIEILVTSITPMQLLTGKIIGLSFLGLTQVVALLAAIGGGLAVAGSLDFLQGVVLPLDLIMLSMVYYLLAYYLLAALLVGISVLTNSEQESRQISG
ncbi:MAG: ABC transporter permease, partial [Armatimonadetes bacterium]|nr:ABC transporter permease [Anaerolineae bacterium]